MMTQAEAKQLGREAAKQLGAGWKVRTWENLGWHACVDFGVGYLAASQGAGVGMTLYIHPRGNHCTYSVMAMRATIGEGRTAKSAVRRAHARLKEMRLEVERLMVPLWSAIGGKRA